MTNEQVAHRWANQIEARGRGMSANASSMFFSGSKIYSYGRHFCMSEIDEDNKVVRFNAYNYSRSTLKHQSYVRSAIDYQKYKVISYRFAHNILSDWINVDSYYYEFQALLEKLGRARKPTLYVSKIQGIQSEVTKALKYLGILTKSKKKDKKLRELLTWRPTEANLQAIKERKEALKLAKVKEREKFTELLTKWSNFELNMIPNRVRAASDTYLRVKGDTLETSKGMKVNIQDAVRVYRLWTEGKALGVEIESGGHMWQCTKVNGSIKFGCHVITFEHATEVITPYLQQA